MIVRIGKNEEAVEGYAREWRLSPAIRERLPVAVPEPVRYSGPSDALPFGMIAYRKLPGRSLESGMVTPETERRLADGIAGFLYALHAIPLDELRGVDLPANESWASEAEVWRDRVLPPLRGLLSADEYTRIVHWWDEFLADRAMADYPPCLIHGDLWYEHVLVEGDGTVVGVLDFEKAGLGDPAADLAVQRYLGERFAGLVLDAYRRLGGAVDEGFEHRVQKLWELREFDGVQFSARMEDREEMEDSVRKLRAGPVLNGSE